MGCTFLEEVQLPDALLKIDDNTFSGCESLKEIRIPENVTKIGGSAFRGCKSLKEAWVPKTAKIGEDAFPETTILHKY